MDFRKIIDDNRTEVVRMLMIYLVCLGVFIVIQVFTRAVSLLFLLVAPLLMTIAAMLLLSRMGNIMGKGFYGGRRARPGVDELARGELDKIRFSKRSGRYEEALQITEELLKKYPDYPEALLMKARILYEDYGYRESARKCLQRIIDTVPADRETHRWASHYLEQLTTAAEPEKGKG